MQFLKKLTAHTFGNAICDRNPISTVEKERDTKVPSRVNGNKLSRVLASAL